MIVADFLLTIRQINRTIEGITALCAAERAPDPKQVEIFLFTCFRASAIMCQAYQQKPDEERKPMILSAEGIEIGRSPLWKAVDGFDS
jgi:hypothetical protein